jgi:hypothetical protein
MPVSDRVVDWRLVLTFDCRRHQAPTDADIALAAKLQSEEAQKATTRTRGHATWRTEVETMLLTARADVLYSVMCLSVDTALATSRAGMGCGDEEA